MHSQTVVETPVEAPKKKLRYPARQTGAPKDGLRVEVGAPVLKIRGPGGSFTKKVFARDLPMVTFRIIGRRGSL
jgi:hypothetical protein